MHIYTGYIQEAMRKYAEVLTASDFTEETSNIDYLVIPVLCNLASCCIQIGIKIKKFLYIDVLKLYLCIFLYILESSIYIYIYIYVYIYIYIYIYA
jgi:hypothetical protein